MNDNLRVIIEDTQTTNKENHSELFREQHEIVHTTTRSNKFKDCSLRAASELLPLITSLPSGFSVFVTSAKLLQKVFDKERVKKELQDFVEEKTDKEVSKYCAGLIKLYVQYIVYLQGVGITVMSSKELETVKITVKPLKVVDRMIRIWEEIDAIKKDNVKRRNFELLMKFSKAYVYLSFLRDFIFVIFCRILEVNSEVNAMNGFKNVLENQQSQDLKLLDFFVEPSNETVTFFCMYNPSKWPVVEMLLNDYFFPNRIKQFEQTEQFLCEGNFIIKSKKFNGPLYFADIACTWFRWSDKENEQSAVNFKKCERNGKTYFQICSKKWPEYVANIGKTEWWVRGMPCSNPCDSGLWEIVHTKDDLYVLSPINSRALYMTTDRFKRVYGNRCTVSEYELFIIESVSD